MSLKAVCQQEVCTISKEESIQKAAELMKKNNIGVLIVVNKQNGETPIGILTDRDIVTEIIADSKDYNELCVENIMSKDILKLNNQQGIKEALEKMYDKGVRRAPVVNENDKIVGIATFDDLFSLIADEITLLSKLIHKQIAA